MSKVGKKSCFAFFSKEKATMKPIVSFDRVYQRTSKALGVSYTSITMLVRVYSGTSLLWYEFTLVRVCNGTS